MTDEAAIRERLGVPTHAAEVVVICESTHWDPDWLLTSTEYLRLMVAPTLDRALDALDAEPRRVYSAECAFFPDAYLRARPERHDQFVRLANEGRLCFTGSGVTTPDTLLPEDESLLRDLLEGSEWLRAAGITVEPRMLYLPDSFGHSPGVPAVLAAAGIDHAGICRIDGMRFPGAELEAADHFPWPGTSAAQLVEAGTADFVWRAPDGAEVLTHWHAFGYGHGDMIGHGGFSRLMGLPLAWPSRHPDKVAARIEGFLAELRPLARTPYRLLTIGFDFSRPVTRLTELIDEWNAAGYERTGAWLVNAAQDDYFDLVATHRDTLPTIELDPNPYWSGFYATRPALKRAVRDLGRDLVDLDARRAAYRLDGARADESNPSVAPRDRCDEARWIVAAANHHDLVTGTSPDRTVRREQWPWLRRAATQLDAALGRDADSPDTESSTGPTTPAGRRDGDRVTVATAHFTAIFDEAHGGTLLSLVDAAGNERVGPRSLSCVAIAERGGLWRMGFEFPGGRWQPVDATADHPAAVTATRDAAGVRVVIDAVLERRPAQLVVDFPDDAPSVVVAASITPRRRRTVTLSWRGTAPIAGLEMHQPGGVVTRALHKRFEPTFWPLHSWAVVSPVDTGAPGTGTTAAAPSPAIATAVPTAVHAWPNGTTETVVARTAPRELAWGVVPLLGPAMGHERGIQTAHLAFGWHARTEQFHRTGRQLQDLADRAAGRVPPTWPVTIDDPDRDVLSVKPADRGEGIIVRLRNWEVTRPVQTLRLGFGADHPVTGASRCDSNERDLAVLRVTDGHAEVPLDAHLISVRLLG
ncbi:MAG TPA: hypothetical protein VFN21_09065 [Acidimicrobiales bacterium]|nr:hypothetical protein [Acidimicrobiales bacterium]